MAVAISLALRPNPRTIALGIEPDFPEGFCVDGVDVMRRDEVVSVGSQGVAAEVSLVASNGRPITFRAADVLCVADLQDDVQPLSVEPRCEVFFGGHSQIVHATQADVLALINSALAALPQTQVVVEDQKLAGTDGGDFTSGAFQTRDLNTIVSDPGSLATLNANQITLLSGTYLAWINVPGHFCSKHAAKLRNITDGADELLGSNSDAQTQEMSDSIIMGLFVIAASKVFEIQQQCETTRLGDGFGHAHGFQQEIYTRAMFWRIGD